MNLLSHARSIDFSIAKAIFLSLLVSLTTWSASAQQTDGVLGTKISTSKGVVVAARSWDISAEVSNKISRIHFIQGQIVKRGDLLVEFDTGFKKLEVALAEAALARASAQLELANEVFDRQEELKSKNAVSLAVYKDALFGAEIAQADQRATEVELEMARSILEAQKLYAPFNGQMSAPRYRENANVDISDGAEIATLVQLDPIHVLFSVPYERVLIRMQSEMTDEEVAASIKVVLELPDGSTYPHHGKIISAGFDLDPETGLNSVLVEFPNPRRVLRPGLKLTATGYEQ
jgi:RND family efflux transporter MFP subunit